jgi:hypothetical protein
LTGLAPLCVIQLLVAQPLLAAFFPRWSAAAEVLRWMSVGLFTYPLIALGGALLLARGHYVRLAFLTGMQAVLTLAAALIGSLASSTAGGVAHWTGIAEGLGGLLVGWSALREFGHGAREFAAVLAKPALMSIASGLAGWATIRAVPDTAPIGQVVAVVLVVIGTFVVLGAWWARDLYHEVLALLRARSTTSLEVLP